MREFYDAEGRRLPFRAVEERELDREGRSPREWLESVGSFVVNAFILWAVGYEFSFSWGVTLVVVLVATFAVWSSIEALRGRDSSVAPGRALVDGALSLALGLALLAAAVFDYPANLGSARWVAAGISAVPLAGAVRAFRRWAVDTEASGTPQARV
jgi:hypothetical protein